MGKHETFMMKACGHTVTSRVNNVIKLCISSPSLSSSLAHLPLCFVLFQRSCCKNVYSIRSYLRHTKNVWWNGGCDFLKKYEEKSQVHCVVKRIYYDWKECIEIYSIVTKCTAFLGSCIIIIHTLGQMSTHTLITLTVNSGELTSSESCFRVRRV